MVDRSIVGRSWPTHSADVEAGRLRLFAKAVGEARPEYVDDAAARAAGHPALPAPPTFAVCLYLEVPDPFAWLRDVGIALASVLHAAQEFRYFAPIHAGDRLTFASRIDGVVKKKGGALTFVTKDTVATNQRGVRVVEFRSTIVVRDGGGAAPARGAGAAESSETGAAAVPAFDRVQVGDVLPTLALPPVTRTTLALYAGASGDHNPIHIDVDFARAAGMPDVFAHGMLSMAWLGRLLTNWTPQRNLREFGVRFAALTRVGERIVCSGRVTDKLQRDGERLVRVELATANGAGEVKLTGEALVALP